MQWQREEGSEEYSSSIRRVAQPEEASGAWYQGKRGKRVVVPGEGGDRVVAGRWWGGGRGNVGSRGLSKVGIRGLK